MIAGPNHTQGHPRTARRREHGMERANADVAEPGVAVPADVPAGDFTFGRGQRLQDPPHAQEKTRKGRYAAVAGGASGGGVGEG